MATILIALSLISVAAWAYLLSARGGFWFANQVLGSAPPRARAWPEVVAVIPARDEADTIRTVLEAHGASDYPGRFSVIVVDDQSSDGTGEIARSVAACSRRRITVIGAAELPEGWSGKLWAVNTGLSAADRLAPDAPYVLLCDADIRLAADTLERLVGLADDKGVALTSLMARLDDRGPWGGLLIPAFVFFFQKLYPFPSVNDPANVTAAAAGGCMLVSRQVLRTAGGIGAIREALIDDCALARLIKGRPPTRQIWLGLARDAAVSLRDNRSLASIWRMVARTAFAELKHSVVRLVGAVIGMLLIYLAGPLMVLGLPLHGVPAAAGLGAIAWLMMAQAYWPTLRHFARPRWQALLLPLAGLFYTLMTLDSARRHWLGRGGAWKGRTYPA